MESAYLPFFVWTLASAMALAIVGGFLLVGGRSRPRGALPFGLFAILWGVQIAASAVAATAGDRGLSQTAYLLSLAVALPLPYFLIEYAASQTSARTRPAWNLARGVAALLGAVVALVLLTDPRLVFAGVELSDGRYHAIWGPLRNWAVVLPFFAAFGIVLLALWRVRANAPTPRLAGRTTTALLGLGIYVSFTAGNNLAFYSALTLLHFDAPRALFVLLFGLLALVCVVLAALALREAARATDDADRRRAMILAAALVAPAIWGLVEAGLVLTTLPTLETVGLWRLAGVCVIAYGIARWRSYDLPQRARSAAAAATGTSAAFATGAAAYGAGSLVAASAAVPVAAGLIVLAAALLPALRFARRVFGVDATPKLRDHEQALYGQRIDTYRAAVEASIARGTLDEDGPFLAALRERFAITPDEDRLITHLARSSVIVARNARAWDAYERLRLLGEGGGGRTWLARDRARDRLVVLKEPLERWQQDPSAREIVLREARLAAKVRHPNVVAVEEVVEGRGSPVIVMEYLEGGSLRDVLRARGTLPWPEARAIAIDMLRGVEAVHAAGVVHRDVKPSNILLDAEGVAKVADFGIAVSPATSSERTMVIDPAHSTIAGTLHYMAPEARAGSPPDRRADVYGCAAVLHEMLYGAPPGLPGPMVVRHDLPPALGPVLARALAAEPSQRTPSARALAEDLARL